MIVRGRSSSHFESTQAPRSCSITLGCRVNQAKRGTLVELCENALNSRSMNHFFFADQGLGWRAILGIVLGSLAFIIICILILVCICFFCCQRDGRDRFSRRGGRSHYGHYYGARDGYKVRLERPLHCLDFLRATNSVFKTENPKNHLPFL